MHVKPSEMPLAEAHAIGNANQLKAETLANYLTATLLPAMLTTGRLTP